MLPADDCEGFVGLLRAQDAAAAVECGAFSSGGSSSSATPPDKLLPVGTMIRARFLRDPALVDKRLLRICGASCGLSLLSAGPPVAKPPGVIRLGVEGSTEWPTGGIVDDISADIGFV